MESHPNWSTEGGIFISLVSRDKHSSLLGAFKELGYFPHTWESSWRDPPDDKEFGPFCSQWVRSREKTQRYPRFHLDLEDPKVVTINGVQLISARIRVHFDVARHTKLKSSYAVQLCREEVSRIELALPNTQV